MVAVLSGTESARSLQSHCHVSAIKGKQRSFMMRISTLRSRWTLVILAALLAGIALTANVTIQAQQNCSEDLQGANDEPGQKDVTYGCVDSSEWPTKLVISWQWDEISWSGDNSGDSCITFDSNGNGNADYAMCLSVAGTPAELSSGPTLYTCRDTFRVNCDGSEVIPGPYQTNCTVDILPLDPFPEGAESPLDTVANCEIYLDDFGSETPLFLIDDCSYPSPVPNSDPSDCILSPTGPTALTIAEPISAGGSVSIPLGQFAAGMLLVLLLVVPLVVWRRQAS
jgi:hypothetical protein